jgi:Terminase large subunit, T4likevirus-type, N-terminal
LPSLEAIACRILRKEEITMTSKTLTGGVPLETRRGSPESAALSPATATVRLCQLKGCDKPLSGRQRAFCGDAHRNKAFKQQRREAARSARNTHAHAGLAPVATAPAILGYREPRFRLVPPSTGSRASEAIALARSANLTLDGWQEDFLEASMGVQDGSWAASEAVLIAPRQNGKTELVAVRAAWEVVHAPNRLVVFTSHLFKTDREAFRQCRALLEAPAFAHLEPTFYRSNGNEAIELNNGSRIQFLARSGGSGRGFTAHLLVVDESFSLSEETFADLKPSIVAAADAQLWIVSSAPHPDSEVLRRYCIRGRAGEDTNLVYFEFSAAEEAAADSIEAWRQSNPALGLRIPLEAIASGFASMSTETFEREHLGRWSEAASLGVFPEWDSLANHDPPTPTGTRAIGIDVSPDRRRSTIAAAAALDGDRVLIEIVDERAGLDWVADAVAALQPSPDVVVVDGASQAHSLIEPLRNVGIDATETDLANMVEACGWFTDAVLQGRLVHTGDPVLTAAVQGAQRRSVGDGRQAWARRSSKANITGLVAATLALWGQKTGPKRFWYFLDVR